MQAFKLLAPSSNSTQHIVNGADHDSFCRDRETTQVSVAVILQAVEAARTGKSLFSEHVVDSE